MDKDRRSVETRCVRWMKVLKITDCTDGMMWYAGKVGTTVPYLGDDIDRKGPIYWSREPAGYKNMVFQKDAIIIETED